MYADRPRSRIAREFFYILSSLRDHYRALFRMRQDEPVRINRMLILLSIYMLREEGMKIFRPQDVIRETGLPQSTVYRIFTELTDEGLLEETMGEFECLSETPDFLVNPKELYGLPLATVKDKDYHTEDKIQAALTQFAQQAKVIVAEEISKQTNNFAPPGVGIGGLADMTQTAKQMPMAPIRMPKQAKDLLDEEEDEDAGFEDFEL